MPQEPISKKQKQKEKVLTLQINKVTTGEVQEQGGGYVPVTLTTNLGAVEARYYPTSLGTSAAIWVGGAGGGWDTPGYGQLYPRLCTDLRNEAISSLRVKYRHPNYLEECVLDVLAGLTFLKSQGIKKVSLGGHSFGGAVVIGAAAACPLVKTVVALSTQTYGVDPAAELGPRCSLLLIHGTRDAILPARCSQYVYAIAQEPKKLLLYKGTGHGLDETADEIYEAVRSWIIDALHE
jgi:pimeloyl-ACP methyl ester carboxylesterase